MSIKIFDVPNNVSDEAFSEFMQGQIEAFKKIQEKEQQHQQQKQAFEESTAKLGFEHMESKINKEIEYIDKISPTYTGVLLDVLQNEKKQLQGLPNKTQFTPSEISKLKEINFKYKE